MTLSSIIKEFLVSECGFSDYQVHETFREITVHLSGKKLHFLITNKNRIDCWILHGDISLSCSASAPLAERVLFDWVDISNPKSFDIIRKHMSEFLPKNNPEASLMISPTSSIIDSRK